MSMPKQGWVTCTFAMLLSGCAAFRGADPGVAAADRIFGQHTAGLAVTVVVPSADRGGRPIEQERLREAVQRTEAEMARLYGGYTTHTGTHGGWLNERGAVEVEAHAAVVTTYGGGKDADRALKAVRELAASLARELNQQCVAVIVNDRMYLVSPAAGAAESEKPAS